MQVGLPPEMHHRSCLLPKQPGIFITNVLLGLTLKLKVIFIAWLGHVTVWAKLL